MTGGEGIRCTGAVVPTSHDTVIAWYEPKSLGGPCLTSIPPAGPPPLPFPPCVCVAYLFACAVCVRFTSLCVYVMTVPFNVYVTVPAYLR